MYHFVREIKKSNFPNIKGLEFSSFKNQIDFLKKKFNILKYNDLIEILKTRKIPKKPSVILTFDDGYNDHYKYVYPYLLKNNISGFFYPVASSVMQNKILDANILHFILEKETNSKKLLGLVNFYLKKYLNKNISELDLSNANLKSRFDDKNTILFKQLLQYIIPKNISTKIINKIFEDIMNVKKEKFFENFYLSTVKIQEMYSDNMHFGIHGYNHNWLEYLNKKKQYQEILKSINFFKKINLDLSKLSICYPFGSYNQDTIRIVKKLKINFGLTSVPGTITIKNVDKKFIFPRFDTNDFL